MTRAPRTHDSPPPDVLPFGTTGGRLTLTTVQGLPMLRRRGRTLAGLDRRLRRAADREARKAAAR